MDYKIKDNFLSKEENNYLYKTLTNNYFPWFYVDCIGKPYDNKRFYFTHMFMLEEQINSEFYKDIEKTIISKLDYNKIYRVKANCFVKEPKNFKSEKHVDEDFDHKVLIYYLNTNNGHTLLEDKVKIDSINNRALFFNGSIKHSAVSQTDTKIRLNINITYD
tara:strand:- start:2845 stop:3330 length:486 start_codon:yes stop_codon:yes gene_type:complete